MNLSCDITFADMAPKLVAAAALIIWTIAFFTIFWVPPIVLAAACSFSLFGRANRLADEYVAARSTLTGDPFGPRPLHRAWYRDRDFTQMLQRMSRDLSLYGQETDPSLDALRGRAQRASWWAAIAFPVVSGIAIFAQQATWSLVLGY